MKYCELYTDFRALFPSQSVRFDRLAEEMSADESDGMHIMFSFVVIPFVLELLREEDSEALKKAFHFFEEMASSSDASITEVLEFTVIENLMSNGIAIYETAKKYMGTEMLKSCENVSQYLDIADSQ